MMFHVGQKIRCVCDAWETPPPAPMPPHLPKLGAIYHVRGNDPYQPQSVQYIWLEEIINPTSFAHEPSFIAVYFRPVVERKTDISIFTRMLTDERADRWEKLTRDLERALEPFVRRP